MAVSVCCPTCRQRWEFELGESPRCQNCRQQFDPIQGDVRTTLTVDGIGAGDTLAGKYELLQVIGLGGMGVVFLARHCTLDTECAIKFLPGNSGELDRLRFEREGKLLASVHHPNVVEIYDLELAGSPPYLIMEYIRGRNLKQLVKDRPGGLPWQDAVSYTAAAARGLAAVHRQRSIHRDIKPSNLMKIEEPYSSPSSGLTPIKLMDFGLARLWTAHHELTLPGQRPGTPTYMSPEQFNDEPLDARSDIYSLGGTLYFLLTGSHPYAGTAKEIMTQVLRGNPPPPVESITTHVPQAVCQVVRRAMAFNA
ncbi:MAG: serine/threonine protein kinase, partial [Planctomycetes bacterium]|nr:serine/threonine protein kinase [Planctomycetota bacterium]